MCARNHISHNHYSSLFTCKNWLLISQQSSDLIIIFDLKELIKIICKNYYYACSFETNWMGNWPVLLLSIFITEFLGNCVPHKTPINIIRLRQSEQKNVLFYVFVQSCLFQVKENVRFTNYTKYFACYITDMSKWKTLIYQQHLLVSRWI